MASDRILFVGTFLDKNFLPHLKGCVGGASVPVCLTPPKTLLELKMLCKKQFITQVISTSVPLLEKLLEWDKRAKPTLSEYAGSLFTIGTGTDADPKIEVVFIPPLQRLVTMGYGKFLATRFINKFTKRSTWTKPTDFNWELAAEHNVEEIYTEYSKAFIVAVDIETLREDAQIRCLSYTAFFSAAGSIRSHTVVLPMDSMFWVVWMRKFNLLAAPKVLQNGKYDIAYFARFNAPLHNYAFDTANMFHAWLSELPKNLGFINAFLIREAMYWKDLAHTDDLMEYYRYNALDTWATGNAFIAMLLEVPQYAITNYALEFPLVFPCHKSEMTGIKRDMDKLAEARKQQEGVIASHSASLDKMLGVTNFNTNSPIQMKALFKILGCGDLKKQDEKNIEKARFRHPLNARILAHVIAARKARKVVSTYLTVGEKAKEFNGRILYSLNPHATDTSRLASASHHFWCGYNVQNQPRGPIVKQTYKADPDFLFAEVDLSQAESRDTAYISGDAGLISAVEHSPDFHSANASAFFGVPFEAIFDASLAKVLDKKLRDLAKRVNHGANYNMGWMVLIDTMGERKIIEARGLLGLSRIWSMRQVAEHLLAAFHEAYPGIVGTYYKGMVSEVVQSGYLKSMAIHHDSNTIITADNWEASYDGRAIGSWTRRCFGNPTKSKPVLNSYIAHCPQSLNAQTLNKGMLRVFNEITINPVYANNIKVLAQVHDSILFQYRIGHHYLCDMVRERMEIPVTIKAYDGKVRSFTVPADVKDGIDGKVARYWSETE